MTKGKKQKRPAFHEEPPEPAVAVHPKYYLGMPDDRKNNPEHKHSIDGKAHTDVTDRCGNDRKDRKVRKDRKDRPTIDQSKYSVVTSKAVINFSEDDGHLSQCVPGSSWTADGVYGTSNSTSSIANTVPETNRVLSGSLKKLTIMPGPEQNVADVAHTIQVPKPVKRRHRVIVSDDSDDDFVPTPTSRVRSTLTNAAGTSKKSNKKSSRKNPSLNMTVPKMTTGAAAPSTPVPSTTAPSTTAMRPKRSADVSGNRSAKRVKTTKDTVMTARSRPNQTTPDPAMSSSPLTSAINSVSGSSAGSAVREVVQVVQDQRDKETRLVGLYDRVSQAGARVLICVSTAREASRVENALSLDGHEAIAIHGDRSAYQREEAIQAFRDGRYAVLVATDEVSRNLALPRVSCVINFSMPSNMEEFGRRLARVGRQGIVCTFFTPEDRSQAGSLVSHMRRNGQTIPPALLRLAGVSARS